VEKSIPQAATIPHHTTASRKPVPWKNLIRQAATIPHHTTVSRKPSSKSLRKLMPPVGETNPSDISVINI